MSEIDITELLFGPPLPMEAGGEEPTIDDLLEQYKDMPGIVKALMSLKIDKDEKETNAGNQASETTN